jgi:GDPmannose 4,6-dehydratase
MYGDNTKAKSTLDWKYDLNIYQTLDLLLSEELKNQ